MGSVKKILWSIFTFQLCCICFFIDARMPSCERIEDKCECHRSYTNFKNETNQQPRNCLKAFSEKKSWDSASDSCAQEFSTLIHTHIEPAFLEDFRNRGVDLIWIGIKREMGFYTVKAPMEYVFKAWKNNEVGLYWEDDEPIHDCVALNISSGRLVTQNCSTELEYACQNFGFPVFPVANSLACPKEWFFFYQLPFGRLRCIKPYKKDSETSNETATCLELGSQVGDNQDFRDLYIYMRRLNAPGYQVMDPSGLCVTKFIERVLGINMNLRCSDKIFICERDTRKIYNIESYPENEEILTAEENPNVPPDPSATQPGHPATLPGYPAAQPGHSAAQPSNSTAQPGHSAAQAGHSAAQRGSSAAQPESLATQHTPSPNLSTNHQTPVSRWKLKKKSKTAPTAEAARAIAEEHKLKIEHMKQQFEMDLEIHRKKLELLKEEHKMKQEEHGMKKEQHTAALQMQFKKQQTDEAERKERNQLEYKILNEKLELIQALKENAVNGSLKCIVDSLF